MCDCIKESEKKVTAFITEELKKKNPSARVLDTSSNGYQCIGFQFDNNRFVERIFLPFEITYVVTKANGEESKQKTHKTTIKAVYCPFCGKKV